MITFKVTRDEFQFEIDYPKIKYYSYSEYKKINPEIFALVNEDGTGIIICSTSINSSYKIGDKITDGLNTNYWSDFLGTLVLCNNVHRVKLNQDKFNEI